MLDTTQTIHRRPPASALRELLQSEAGGGIVLMVAAAAALAIANSPLAPAYFGVLKTYVGGLSILHWINDALMAVFFCSLGWRSSASSWMASSPLGPDASCRALPRRAAWRPPL